MSVQKEQSMILQKRMLAGYFDDLAAALRELTATIRRLL